MLHVQDLHVAYGAIVALRGISFSVYPGQVVTLIGANGAGKSTTLNAISGLIKARSGQVIYQGQNILGKRAEVITGKHLVQVPEGRQIIAPMTVQENLEMGAFLRRDRQGIQADLAGIYGRFPRLYERRKQKAGSLSGGEQQMLAVGRALMARPQVLMLDEPSMGLAPLLVNEVFSIIADIKASGTTILLVEQNARKALQIADYAYVMERGTIVKHGVAAAMQNDPEVIAAYLG